MGLTRAILLAALALGAVAPALAQPAPAATIAAARQDEDARLLALLNSFARAQESLDPLGAVARGDNSNPQGLQRLFSDELAAAQRAELRRELAALARIDRTRLSPERQLSYDAFQQQAREALGWLSPDIVALTQVRPFNHFGGLHEDFPSLIGPSGSLPYRDERDYRRNLALLRALPLVLDRAIGRFRQGMASDVVETRLTTVNMIAQLDAILAEPALDSVFAEPLVDMRKTFLRPARPSSGPIGCKWSTATSCPPIAACATSWRKTISRLPEPSPALPRCGAARASIAG